MSRDICIFQSFLTPAHKAQITAAAEAAGMTPYFFTMVLRLLRRGRRLLQG